jgi:uncharacterized protein
MRIIFHSEGIALAGEIRGDDGPAIVLTGPFTGVKEQVTGTYARLLAAAGFVTLAFDHRGFGESGGRRGHEDSQGKLADLRAAVSVMSERSERVSVVGICLGGGYAVRAAASDPRVGAVAAIAGAFNSPARMVGDMSAGPYRFALAEEPYAYYGDRDRSFSPHWRNEVTRGSLHSLMTFDALGAAGLLADTPLLIVHGRKDAYCSPELAQALYDGKPGDKQILWLDADQHIDLYDSQPHVAQAVEATAEFLHRKLDLTTHGGSAGAPQPPR